MNLIKLIIFGVFLCSISMAVQYGFILDSCTKITNYPSIFSLKVIDNSGSILNYLNFIENESLIWTSPTNQTYGIKLNSVYFSNCPKHVSDANFSFVLEGQLSNHSLSLGRGAIITDNISDNSNFTLISDFYGNIYSENHAVDENGLTVRFNPNIPFDSVHVPIKLLNQSWVILNLDDGSGGNQWSILLGKENELAYLEVDQNISIGGLNWTFRFDFANDSVVDQIVAESGKNMYQISKLGRFSQSYFDQYGTSINLDNLERNWWFDFENDLALFENSQNNSSSFWTYIGQTKKVGSEYLHPWWRSHHSSFGVDRRYLLVSVLNETIELNSPSSGAWAQIYSDGLNSFFIPKSSPLYQRFLDSSNVTSTRFTNPQTGIMYGETVRVNPSGSHISFNPTIPMFQSNTYSELRFDNLFETSLSEIKLNNSLWKIVRLRGPNSTFSYYVNPDGSSGDHFGNITANTPELILGKGTTHVISSCENLTIGNHNYTLHVSGGIVLLANRSLPCSPMYASYFNLSDGQTLSEVESLKQIDGKWVGLSVVMPIDATWAELTVYDELLNLSNASMVWENRIENLSQVTWRNSTPIYSVIQVNNPQLRSVFIANSSGDLKVNSTVNKTDILPVATIEPNVSYQNNSQSDYGQPIEGGRDPPSWLDVWVYQIREFLFGWYK